MKKVIRNGNVPVRSRTCFFCSCEFSYEEADIEFKPSAEECRGTGLKPCKIVTCPQCGRINVLWNPNVSKDKYSESVDTESTGYAEDLSSKPYYTESAEKEEL